MYPYDLDAGEMSGVEERREFGRKCQTDGMVPADGMLPQEPLIFVESASMSLSDAKSQGHQFFAARCSAEPEDCFVKTLNEKASIYMLTNDVDCKVDSIFLPI